MKETEIFETREENLLDRVYGDLIRMRGRAHEGRITWEEVEAMTRDLIVDFAKKITVKE